MFKGGKEGVEKETDLPGIIWTVVKEHTVNLNFNIKKKSCIVRFVRFFKLLYLMCNFLLKTFCSEQNRYGGWNT